MPRLLKSKADLPAWYPLEVYSQELSAEEWFEQLFMRFAFHTALRKTNDNEKMRSHFIEVVVKNNWSDLAFFDDVRPAWELWGIRELSAFELAYLAAMMLDSKEGRKLIEEIQEARLTRNMDELIRLSGSTLDASRNEDFESYINWVGEPFEMADVLPRYPLSIDMYQDDETLKEAFAIILIRLRDRITGPAKQAFSDRDFREWSKYGILQIFDLRYWASLSNSKYTDSLLASTIWPEEEIDVVGRLRKVAHPKFEMLFKDWSAIGRLARQIELIKSLNELWEEKRNRNKPN